MITNNTLKDKFEAAIEAKSNDVNSFKWKGPKEDYNGHKIQREIALVDATDDQLKNFYKHCMSMLYNTNPINPGRIILINQIQEDRDKCCTELFLKYLENTYKSDTTRPREPRNMYMEKLNQWLATTTVGINNKNRYELPITAVSDDIPEEFSRLSVGMIQDGCLNRLGEIHKKPITLNFILSLGVWFTPEEMVELTEKDPETGKVKDRRKVIIERLQLKNNVRIKLDPKGLTYREFRAMINLRKNTFDRLTTEQLITLKNKVLFMLEEEAIKHSEFWKDKIRQIKMVADMRGLNIETD